MVKTRRRQGSEQRRLDLILALTNPKGYLQVGKTLEFMSKNTRIHELKINNSNPQASERETTQFNWLSKVQWLNNTET